MQARKSLFGCWIVIAIAACGVVEAAPGPVPGHGLWQQYSDVAAAGFDPVELDAIRLLADEAGSGALFVVRGGRVVAAWGDVERKFKCHSMRKSFLSALYGPAVVRGEIDLNATLASLGIDDLEPLSDVEKQATVEQLIQARSGVYHPAAKEPGSMKEDRPERGSRRPGEAFWYNNWDFNTAGYVYEQATGRGIFEAFYEEIARPIGMQDFSLDDTVYQYERNLSRVPAYAFRLSARDAARFGLLYLRDGKWGRKRILPGEWIERGWTAHSRFDDGEGYGYMWWVYGPGSNPEHPELSGYAARGTGGQLIFVVPKLDLVIVHRADTDFGRGVSGRHVWQIVRGVIDAVSGDVAPRARTRPVEAVPFSHRLPPLELPRVVELSAEELDRYVGEYRIDERIDVRVERLGDILVGSMTGFGQADFWPIGDHEFWGKAVGVRVRFDVDDSGTIVAAHVFMRGQEMVARPVER